MTAQIRRFSIQRTTDINQSPLVEDQNGPLMRYEDFETALSAIAADRKREGEAAQYAPPPLMPERVVDTLIPKGLIYSNVAVLQLLHEFAVNVQNEFAARYSAAPVSAGLSDEEICTLWCSIPTTGRMDRDIVLFARALSARLLPEGWVAVKDRLLIDVCYIEGDDPFICGVHGKAALNTLADIEAQLCQSAKEEDGLLAEEGEYRFAARYEPAQRGDFGRIEFDAYWDLTRVSYQPLDAAIAAAPSTEGNISQQAKPMPKEG